jgi:hypothetical protein
VSGLHGKRILFIGIGFYDYEMSIVTRLRQCGAIVQAFFDRPAALRSSMLANSLRLAHIGTGLLIRLHEQRILRCIESTSCDYVLIIKSIDLRPQFLETLRNHQRRAEFILYQWDSLARLPGIGERLRYFDRVLTFDRNDSVAQAGLRFRPLFYRTNVNIAAQFEQAPDLDLCFVGWLHSDRLEMIRRLQSIASAQHLSFFVYLFTGVRTCVKLWLEGKAAEVHTRTLPYSELEDIYRRSRVVVDLPHALQSGLTMRAIEAVGHGRKLITTAVDVVNYDFYPSGNVQLIRADHPQLDAHFARTPPAPYSKAIQRRYSLDAWIEDVFALPERLQEEPA